MARIDMVEGIQQSRYMPEKHGTVREYINAKSGIGREMAERICAIIADAVPDATDTIKYNMPAFQISGKSFLYLAVWTDHVGIYPIYRGDEGYEKALAPFRAKKDTVQFKFKNSLPEDLVRRVVLAQAALAGDRGALS